jgi:formylglycine-generating enzyme required for sulfatase activity
VKGLRSKAMEALRAKAGTVVTLKKLVMPGTVKAEPNSDDVSLVLKNGPELRVSASQLDAADVENLLPLESGTGKAADLRRRGLLFLAAGEIGKAEDYLIKAREAGSGDAVAPALERIASARLGEREIAALESWKKAESLFASRSWKAAKQSFESFQREFKETKTMANNADLLTKRLEAIDEAFGPAREVSLDLGSGVKLDLVLIPAGEFEMGSNDGEKNERPVHKVKITRAFYIGKYATTQAQFEKLMGNNPSNFKGEKLPVEMVAYDAAEEFCKKLGKLTGKSFRLPTEAEWEYACRAGTASKFNAGDNEAALESVAWFQANSEGKTHPVGQKKPNAWGLYDMHGNVWQWCADFYAGDYYGKSEVENPQGPVQGAVRVLRGGAFGCAPVYCRSATRFGRVPELRETNAGFRVAASVVKIP